MDCKHVSPCKTTFLSRDSLNSWRHCLDFLWSANVQTLSANVQTLSANVQTLSANVQTLSQCTDTLSQCTDTLRTNLLKSSTSSSAIRSQNTKLLAWVIYDFLIEKLGCAVGGSSARFCDKLWLGLLPCYPGACNGALVPWWWCPAALVGGWNNRL